MSPVGLFTILKWFVFGFLRFQSLVKKKSFYCKSLKTSTVIKLKTQTKSDCNELSSVSISDLDSSAKNALIFACKKCICQSFARNTAWK